MKIIDLLNKIANGEEVPKKIKWGEFELKWEELGYHDYKFLDTGNHLLFQGFATSVLNDEIEIIEEDKKVEKIMWSTTDMFKQEIIDKINEIIEVINEKL